LAAVTEAPGKGVTYEVDCIHCGEFFRAEPLVGATPEQAGFKCPHCGLLVPYERSEADPKARKRP